MKAWTAINNVMGGVITDVTLSIDDLVDCRFAISEAGGQATLKECNVQVNFDEGKLNEAFQVIFTMLKQNGVVAINTEGGSLPIQLGRL